jgi:hypothetical protein
VHPILYALLAYARPTTIHTAVKQNGTLCATTNALPILTVRPNAEEAHAPRTAPEKSAVLTDAEVRADTAHMDIHAI